MDFRTFYTEGEKKRYSKDEIISHWSKLTVRGIIPITPKPHNHYGTSLDEDTVRVTGSREFVDAIMARLKEFLQFETQETELEVRYEQSKYEHAGSVTPNFQFYCSTKYKNPAKKIPKGPIMNFG